MKIGIVGYGKMGKDIFSLFFDKLSGAEFVVMDTRGTEENTAALIKSLDKQLKRKKITEEQYAAKKSSFLFTDKAEDLAGCDAVIEAVFEDLTVKKTLFGKLAEIVGRDCLLLTNTSSLSIADIFADIAGKERCFGMHFFYPVKLTGYTELNVLPENSQEAVEKARALVTEAGKKAIVFSGAYHIYLNQILSCMVAHAIYLRESMGVSVSELRKAFAGVFPVADPFEVLDSVGLGLMAGKPDSFLLERNKGLLAYSCGQMNKWLDEGCAKEPGSFLSFISERESDSGRDASDAKLSITALILNELVNALEDNQNSDQAVLTDAVQDTVGIAETPAYYYKEYGAEAIFRELERLRAVTGFDSYKHADKAVWDKYFCR